MRKHCWYAFWFPMGIEKLDEIIVLWIHKFFVKLHVELVKIAFYIIWKFAIVRQKVLILLLVRLILFENSFSFNLLVSWFFLFKFLRFLFRLGFVLRFEILLNWKINRYSTFVSIRNKDSFWILIEAIYFMIFEM